MDKEELSVLQTLDTILKQESVRAMIESVVPRVEQKLIQGFGDLLAWDPVPLYTYGGRLPKVIHSSWVFVIHALANTGDERHPNSLQRMMSYRGSGDLQIWNGERWCSNALTSDSAKRIEQRWISIPINTWHRAIVPKDNWVVVSFHTVPEDELIEERLDMADPDFTRKRKYLDKLQ